LAVNEYRVLSRRDIVIAAGLPTEFTQVLVTYDAPGLPPLTVFIAKAEHTPELERKLILEDIARRKAATPETFRVT